MSVYSQEPGWLSLESGFASEKSDFLPAVQKSYIPDLRVNDAFAVAFAQFI